MHNFIGYPTSWASVIKKRGKNPNSRLDSVLIIYLPPPWEFGLRRL
jgi:hypothetical protein